MNDEDYVIGHVLLGKDKSMFALSPDDFSGFKHKAIWLAWEQMESAGTDVNVVTTWEHLVATGISAVDLTALSGFVESFVSVPGIEPGIVSRLKEKRRRRELSAKLGHLASLVLSDQHYDAALAELLAISEPEKNQETTGDAEKLTTDAVNTAIAISDGTLQIPYLRSGIEELDSLCGGIPMGGLTVIAGRPSMGKSALSRSITLRAALRGKKSLVFSFEDRAFVYASRNLSELSRIPLTQILRGQPPLESWQRSQLQEASGMLRGTQYQIYDQATKSSMSDVITTARIFKPDVLVVDYVQLVPGPGENKERTEYAIRALKTLSQSIGCAVIAVSQLSRRPEDRDDKRPMMSDLRESGEIEQAADLIVFCYRESAYDREANPREAELIVAKNKNGPIGTANVGFRPELASFC